MVDKYLIDDIQAGYFMQDTQQEPVTLEELRKRFWCLDECRTENYEDFTKEYIEDMWEVRFVKVDCFNCNNGYNLALDCECIDCGRKW